MTNRSIEIPRVVVRFVEQEGRECMVVSGALDADAAPAVNMAFRERIARGRAEFLVDLLGVTMISSAGVGSLIAGIGEARDEGGRVHVAVMSDEVRHVLEMLDLVDYLGSGD